MQVRLLLQRFVPDSRINDTCQLGTEKALQMGNQFGETVSQSLISSDPPSARLAMASARLFSYPVVDIALLKAILLHFGEAGSLPDKGA